MCEHVPAEHVPAEHFASADPLEDIHAWETDGGSIPSEPDPPELDDVIELTEFCGRDEADAEEVWFDAA